jgi:hypothetical protein
MQPHGVQVAQADGEAVEGVALAGVLLDDAGQFRFPSPTSAMSCWDPRIVMSFRWTTGQRPAMRRIQAAGSPPPCWIQ